MSTTVSDSLLWLSPRQAVNPAAIVCVFRGIGGEIEIDLVGGKQIKLNERELSAAARTALLASEEIASGENGSGAEGALSLIR